MLNWDVTNIKDYGTLYPDVVIDQGDGKTSLQWNPTTMALVYAMISIGFGSITSENIEELYFRYSMMAIIHNIKDRVAYSDFLNHIGLEVNVSDETMPEWIDEHLLKGLFFEANHIMTKNVPDYINHFQIPSRIDNRLLVYILKILNNIKTNDYDEQDHLNYCKEELVDYLKSQGDEFANVDNIQRDMDAEPEDIF